MNNISADEVQKLTAELNRASANALRRIATAVDESSQMLRDAADLLQEGDPMGETKMAQAIERLEAIVGK